MSTPPDNLRFIDIALYTASPAFAENRRLSEVSNILLRLSQDLEAGEFDAESPVYALHDSDGQYCGQLNWDHPHTLQDPGMRLYISFEGNENLSNAATAAQLLNIGDVLRVAAETILNADPSAEVSELFRVKGISCLLTDYLQDPDLAMRAASDAARQAAINERVREAMMGVNDQLKVIERGMGTTEETDIIRQEMALMRQLLDGSYASEPQLKEEIDLRVQSLLSKKRSDDATLSF